MHYKNQPFVAACRVHRCRAIHGLSLRRQSWVRRVRVFRIAGGDREAIDGGRL
jgi:hypothetical protein